MNSELKDALSSLAQGDFSTRIVLGSFQGDRDVARLVNKIAARNEELLDQLNRLERVVGKEGKIDQRGQLKDAEGDWQGAIDSVNNLIEDTVQPTAEVSRVIGAVAKGDLSQHMSTEIEGRPLRGEFLRIGKVVNRMVDQLDSFADEVTRVAREVGTEGKLGGQARVRGVAGTWKDLTDNVNAMAGNLTGQVRNIAEVTTAVARGDLSKKITVDVKGEIAELKDTINTMVDQLNSFASEVTRVAREVGTEGKLGGQAKVEGVGGTWQDLTDNVNLMADNLTGQVRNIAEVTTAVARGDLSKKITVEVRGEIAELKDTINTMVDQLNGFASEVTRVAREVGSEGKLGGQAQVEGVAGTWADLTDSVNQMAGNLTDQVRNIAEVTTAVASGDLSKKITVEVRGEIAELKDTINTMVDQLNSFAAEVTRVAREVGTEGKLGGQAKVEGVGGTWQDLTDNVNAMAGNLTGQVRNIAEVTTAVARGDLSKKITVDVKGEIAELKDTINTMVDQLNSFASEVTRVAREVGTEGKLGGQAQVQGVGGTWKDLTDNVNELAANLTGQVRNIAEVTTAVARGDLSKKITVEVRGEIAELKDTINTMVDQLNAFANEVTRVAREVGTEGKLGGQAQVRGVAGTWKDLTDNVNLMADNLTGQVRNIAAVTTAVARGDLSKQITVDVKGEIAELKDTINTMVDQLNSFAAEVTRVAREVGTEGKLGGQAKVPGVGGTWKDLTDNVNLMATNLTDQVRGIADVVTAVAQGNLKRKLTLDAKGEIASLAETINFMIDTLSTFGDQVTSMAREVGIEGRLGGQASVPGAAGLWRDLTDNVNQLAANLTNQVRSIAEVATAVTKGDLTRSISVQASGEMASLKDNINEMIRNLKEQTLKNAEQDWLKTNLARFSRMLQGERELATVSSLIMTELAPLVNAQHGVFYVTRTDDDGTLLELAASYGVSEHDRLRPTFRLGEGLIGQCAVDKKPIWLEEVPSELVRIGTGLGSAEPANVIILPALFEDDVKAVIELASFGQFNEAHRSFLNQFMESVGVVLNTIAATMRTEGLLEQSQLLTHELQSRQTELTTKQDELGRTNEELQEKAQLLEYEKKQVEAKNFEIDMARRAVEEKAEQLALTSKYKSEFLANMSHELRTPLNSLLILSKLLSENPEGNLSIKQTEFARTIHSAGSDLLSLINDILDLSKIESGTVTIDVTDMPLEGLKRYVERNFRQVAADKGIDFTVELDPRLPPTIRTDEKRLQQIVLNLLSNAFKFTSEGSVSLKIEQVGRGWSSNHSVLGGLEEAVGISVQDTGIGIPRDKQKLIFEAFQQADGTTSRKYGGTGLGLSISREIAGLLGGQLKVKSDPGKGSTFHLYIPRQIEAEDQDAEFVSGGAPASVADAVQPSVRSGPEGASAEVGAPIALIVTDDDDVAGRAVAAARAAGFDGIVSTTGTGSTRMAEKLSPRVVSLDLGIEEMHGDVLAEFIRSHEATRNVPLHLIVPDGDTRADGDTIVARDAKPGQFAKSFRKMAKLAADRPVDAPEGGREGDSEELSGKHVLIIDDDIRNIYSLTSVLENEGARVSYAERGRAGIALLHEEKDIDVALIDIMMPELDGYETMRAITSDPETADIPLIAVTAKAMKGDRQKCLSAGASDYIAKPVDIDLLLAMLRVWTGRSAGEASGQAIARMNAAE